jgi:hypothetical protein
VLLLEEPLPEMAAMIQEFLQNSGIVCVVQSETIGLLYRLPMLGSSFSGARVYVRASDFAEARELVAHFFKKSDAGSRPPTLKVPMPTIVYHRVNVHAPPVRRKSRGLPDAEGIPTDILQTIARGMVRVHVQQRARRPSAPT